MLREDRGVVTNRAGVQEWQGWPGQQGKGHALLVLRRAYIIALYNMSPTANFILSSCLT